MKKNILLIINLLIILLVPIFYCVHSSALSIALVLEEYQLSGTLVIDFIKNTNNLMNATIVGDLLIYTGLQLLNYIFYLFKKKNITFFLIIFELIILVFSFLLKSVFTSDLISLILFAPIINNYIYFLLSKDEDKLK